MLVPLARLDVSVPRPLSSVSGLRFVRGIPSGVLWKDMEEVRALRERCYDDKDESSHFQERRIQEL